MMMMMMMMMMDMKRRNQATAMLLKGRCILKVLSTQFSGFVAQK